MTRPASGLVGLLALFAVIPAARAQDAADGLSPWHLDIDVSYGQAGVSFVGVGGVRSFRMPALRAHAGLGHGSLSLEGGIAAPAREAGATHVVWSAGVRLDSAWDAPLSVFLRLAYVRRWGTFEGEGARAGIGLTARPVVGFAIYAEASADVTSVPATMNEAGTFASWSTFLGGGVRLSFGH